MSDVAATTPVVQELGIRATGMAASFGGVRALAGVDLELEAGGATLGIVGPNGSGKSTLLNAITGVIRATGELTMGNQSVPLGRPRSSRAAGIVRTYQTPQTFYAMSCIENVLLSMSDRHGTGLGGAWLGRRALARHERSRRARALDELRRVDLAGYADRPSAILTYGQQRLLELARALAADPIVLLLDEPAAGLNAAESGQLLKLLESVRQRGVSIVLVEHKIDFVTTLSQTLMVLELGKVVARGEPSEIWKNERVIDAYLGRATTSTADPHA